MVSSKFKPDKVHISDERTLLPAHYHFQSHVKGSAATPLNEAGSQRGVQCLIWSLQCLFIHTLSETGLAAQPGFSSAGCQTVSRIKGTPEIKKRDRVKHVMREHKEHISKGIRGKKYQKSRDFNSFFKIPTNTDLILHRCFAFLN